MLRHLAKLIWNRKRANFLILVEIFISFLVVFVVGTLGLFFLDNLHAPLGYSFENVLVASLRTVAAMDETGPGNAETYDQLLAEARALGPVLAVAGGATIPYTQGGWTSVSSFGGRQIESEVDAVTLGYDRALELHLVAGRFFAEGDEVLAWRPVVINARLAREIYGDGDAVGQRFGDPGADSEMRVIGVLEEFRKHGELSKPGHHTLTLADGRQRQYQHLFLKVRPGTPPSFEEELVQRLQAVAPGFSIAVRPLSQLRDDNFRMRLAPLAIGGVVAFFLLAMVALGLVGVLWQNLLRRTREIGLRRAVGADRGEVHRQVLLEQLILTSFGVVGGILLVVQLPLLDLVSFLTPRALAGGLLVATVAIYLLAAACALYPSRLVSRIQPAEALRYE